MRVYVGLLEDYNAIVGLVTDPHEESVVGSASGNDLIAFHKFLAKEKHFRVGVALEAVTNRFGHLIAQHHFIPIDPPSFDRPFDGRAQNKRLSCHGGMDNASNFQLMGIVNGNSLVRGGIDEADIGERRALVLVGKVDVFLFCVEPVDIGEFEVVGLA